MKSLLPQAFVGSQCVGTEADVKTSIDKKRRLQGDPRKRESTSSVLRPAPKGKCKQSNCQVSRHLGLVTRGAWANWLQEASKLLTVGHQKNKPTVALTSMSVVIRQELQAMQVDVELSPPVAPADLFTKPQNEGGQTPTTTKMARLVIPFIRLRKSLYPKTSRRKTGLI